MLKTFILRDQRPAQALWAFLKVNWEACAKAGKPLQITITEEQTSRSLQANKRYWAILKTISETGWVHGRQFTAEAWHHYFRLQFLPRVDAPDGVAVPISTTTLTSEEFAAYVNSVESFAASELGVEFVGAA